MSTSGYSGTPLARKLGYKAGQRVAFVNAPPHYAELLGPLPEGVSLSVTADSGLDLVHIFSLQRAELDALLRLYCRSVFPAGTIWVSWPKKTAAKKLGISTDLSEDGIRELALPLGLVDIKVCAVDEVWSGLKLVWRVELRG